MASVSLILFSLMVVRIQAAVNTSQLLKLCDGLSFPDNFNPIREIGEFYQIGTYSNSSLDDIFYNCPREIWEVAHNGTIYFNRDVTVNKTGYLEYRSTNLAERIPSQPKSSNFIWKTEGPLSPAFGRFSYAVVKWDNRKYLFQIGCRVTGLLQFYVLSRFPEPMSPEHKQRFQSIYNFQYAHEFSFDKCATVRAAECFQQPPWTLFGQTIYFNSN